jgi:2,3-diaminopropionate biosynthesis protein SbnB
MTAADLLVLGAREVATLLRGQEAAILDAVLRAYRAHARARTVVPYSAFLRLPEGRDRVIALPAFLDEAGGVVGMKWIASFPGNVERGCARASGLVVLNCRATGRPVAIVEGSLVSAMRTAASAALAARVLHETAPDTIGVLGCGAIGFETLRFLLHLWPAVARVAVCDLDPGRAARFEARCRATFADLELAVVGGAAHLVTRADVLVIATTAMQPHLTTVASPTLRTILHLSLRDLAPAVVLAADNVVDDPDHVCRAETSLHLAERVVGHRAFIGRTLPAILVGEAPTGGAYGRPTIFSPFGLGILDIAVARLVCDRAAACGMGTRLPFTTCVPA